MRCGYEKRILDRSKDGATAPEAITGDTSPHVGLVFARECAQVLNCPTDVRKCEH
jgi:hypothetical protein